MKSKFKPDFYFYLAIPMTIIAIVHLIFAFYRDYPIMLFWYCYALFALFTLGLWTRSNFLIGSAAVGGFFINFLWMVDFFTLVVFKKLNVGIFAYLFNATEVNLFMTLYHPVMLFLSLFVLFKQEKVHRFAWIGASILLLIFSIMTFFSGHLNINCVDGKCALGIFEFLRELYNLPVPYFIMNIIFMTVIVFIPTQIGLKLILNWIKKGEK